MNVVTEAEVKDLLDLTGAIDAVERALEREAAGAARTMVKTHLTWGAGHTLHAIGGLDETAGLVGTKTWAHTAGGASPLLILWDSETGALRAVVEAFALGQLRTSAMSGVATRRLARSDVDVAALIGTGKQALPQARALAAVLPLTSLRVHSRDPARRAAFASAAADALGIEVVAADSVADAVDGAGVVTTATRATEPFLAASMLAPGAHVNAIGAITPERAELHADVVERAGIVATDSVSSARDLAAELAGHADRVVSIGAVSGRGGADLTVFKAMGIGLADVALGCAILERKGAA